MFECLILGDSVAVGAARAINLRYARTCDVVAEERATASQILSWRMPLKAYGTSIFSLGSNDQATESTAVKLTTIRATVASRRVIWILPYARAQAYLVSRVAARFGDETIDLARLESRDRIHPRRYADLAGLLLK